MKDRIVQYDERYKMQFNNGEEFIVWLEPEPGEIYEEGTPLNKATLLSDSTAERLWPDVATRPKDPTVDEALCTMAQGVHRATMGTESTFQKLIMGRLF